VKKALPAEDDVVPERAQANTEALVVLLAPMVVGAAEQGAEIPHCVPLLGRKMVGLEDWVAEAHL
jgi:hypothetical protein